MMLTHDNPRTLLPVQGLCCPVLDTFLYMNIYTHNTLPRSLAHLTARWLRGSAASNRSSRGHTYTMLADASSSFASCFDRRRRLLLLLRLYRYWLLYCCCCYLLLLRRQRQHHQTPRSLMIDGRFLLARLARTPLRTDNVDPKTLWVCWGLRIAMGQSIGKGPFIERGIPPTTINTIRPRAFLLGAGGDESDI